ncbi:expressed unknown protein [Seminavis robusta]|uniref:Uncharacterized protein n=1 Tax=Seminavis robusta TaxID=568900 RepID=A0A9N8HFL2_9STRA|nr:expressed unknown protein [Seminavis robusta]|eukprot:Sro354_g124852.1  (442) ;mRNA; r:55205-56530
MVESPSLGGYAPIFRSGLKSKSIHTIFDYIFGSAELLRQGGKALSRWVTKIGETTVGGQPPTFDDIDTDPDALRRLTDVIFEDDADGRWHPKVRELLVMTLLLRCDQFVDILQSHPFSKLVEGLSTDGIPEDYSCSSVRDNLFLSRVNQALEKAVGNDRDLIFSNWVGEARRAFLSRNAPGLPIGTFPLYGGDPGGRGILMDTRCFTDHFNALASIAQANHMRLQSLEHKVNDIRSAFNVESKITSSFIVDRLFNIQKSVRRLEENLIGAQTPAPAPTLPKALLRFSRSGPSEGAPVSLTEATIGFFYDNYPAGYELDKRSPSWEEFDSNKKKALGSKLNTIRNAVRVVLLHADSCPLKQNSSEYWNKADIRGIAREAEKRVCEALETLRLNASVQDCKTITISNLERAMKDPKWKEYEKSLVLPANTPDDIRKVLKKNRS